MKCTKEFEAVRPGNVYPEMIPVGEELDGRLLEIAQELGCVEAPKPDSEPKTPAKPKPAAKRKPTAKPKSAANSDPANATDPKEGEGDANATDTSGS